jgi:hypothetical protein
MQIGVIGSGYCSEEIESIAEEVGREIAKRGAILICGGLSGVMEAAARGAKKEKGITVGILPGFKIDEANKYIDIKIPTGISDARNIIIVRASDAIISVSGGYGTLSEIAFALKLRKPIIGIRTWEVSKDVMIAKDPKEAVNIAISLIKKGYKY